MTMPLQAISHYERLLNEHPWMRDGFHWTVVRTSAAPPSIEEIGERLSSSAEAGVEEEVDVASGADLYLPRTVVSVDRQEGGYFLFQSQDGGIDDPAVLCELSERDGPVWSITSILHKHKYTYVTDGEIRWTWREFPRGERPNVDENVVFVEKACEDMGLPFGLAALMAVVELGSGVSMDLNWPHAPRPAVVLDDPLW
ncbi:hypothetical protein FHU36_001018 [Nonomuraea muscovyensis]|uniref:Uncharacterized protein n=1 Tax=Nonomuraea muscovyensis TaxID=1124761 RepID=A0A7X0EWN7_9ACTN|nr:hypothetical protein [Nonomuraea muscovyensis]MBB6344509.1 hypothetical protein [Nonomuraea muscovyensis]